MALNTDYAIRTGAFEPEKGITPKGSVEEIRKTALERYNAAKVYMYKYNSMYICIF